jgi:hypothetical protein
MTGILAAAPQPLEVQLSDLRRPDPQHPDVQRLEVTLRGFSARELTACAERKCARHFGDCPWEISEATLRPCLVSLGGRTRLYEAHFVAAAR